jgi:hypothetical protein
MEVDFAVDHVALAPANRRHVGGDLRGDDAESRALARQMRDPRAPNLVLRGQAGDVGAGAADPATLDHGSPPSRLRHVPSQQLAALSASKDEDLKLVRLRHRRVLIHWVFVSRNLLHRVWWARLHFQNTSACALPILRSFAGNCSGRGPGSTRRGVVRRSNRWTPGHFLVGSGSTAALARLFEGPAAASRDVLELSSVPCG